MPRPARQALPELDLIRQLELYQRLLREAPYSPLVTMTPDSAEQMIRYTETLGMLERQKQPLGDIMRMSEDTVMTSRRTITVHSTNKLLAGGDVPVRGGKTGFIRQAGYCLATLLQMPQGDPMAVGGP